MNEANGPGDVTRLLEELNAGKEDALPALFPLIYDELRRLAAYHLYRERSNHTLPATALVHEAYLRLVNQRAVRWQNRSHFFAIAAQAMRRVLVDHARAREAAKRGSGADALPLDEYSAVVPALSLDVIELDAALTRLAAIDEQQVRVVELRFFAGLSVEETARVLNISPTTVKREWSFARAWLRRELGGADTLPPL